MKKKNANHCLTTKKNTHYLYVPGMYMPGLTAAVTVTAHTFYPPASHCITHKIHTHTHTRQRKTHTDTHADLAGFLPLLGCVVR